MMIIYTLAKYVESDDIVSTETIMDRKQINAVSAQIRVTLPGELLVPFQDMQMSLIALCDLKDEIDAFSKKVVSPVVKDISEAFVLRLNAVLDGKTV